MTSTELTVSERPSTKGVSMSNRAGGATSLVPQTLGDVMGFATVMARADLALPKHLRNNDGACLAVAMQAFEWGMSPFAVANKTYFVNDRLAYEAQLVAAVVNMRSGIVGRPRYTYEGEGLTRRCTVECTMDTGEVLSYRSPMISQIKVQNSPLWKSDPDQQLGYYSIRSWARRHTPEVILGVYDRDEIMEAEPMEKPKANTALSERLAARAEAGKEGFNVVARETSIDPETGEVFDETTVAEPATETAPEGAQDADFEDQATTPADDLTEGPSEPAEEPEPPFGGMTVDQLRDWATSMVSVLNGAKTADAVTKIWAGDLVKTRFQWLKTADENAAKDLYLAVVRRKKDLTTK